MRRPFNSTAGGKSAAGQSARPERDAEIAAVRLLGRREHSTEELRRKLLRQGYGPDLVQPVIEKLAGKRLVSDDRFVASFVREHARRGQGPVRIRAELRQQGIDGERIEVGLGESDLDWAGLARQVRERKFGPAPPRSAAERAKQGRFLQYRGFDADQIRAAFSSEPAAGSSTQAGDFSQGDFCEDELREDGSD